MLIIGAGLALVFAVVFIVVIQHLGAPENTGQSVMVEIPEGAGLLQISHLLQQAGVIKSAKGFASIAKVQGVAGDLKAGEYLIPVGVSPDEVLEQLVQGRVLLRQITIPEGFTTYQIAGTMAEKGFGDEKDILALTRSSDFATSLKLPAKGLEGYLFPETYSYVKGTTARKMLSKMVAQFRAVYDQERNSKTLKRPIRMNEVVILASICEKEARKSDELPLIARVYLNRLKIGMPLQADPTVIYGLKKFDALLTRADLKINTPYNTYMNNGLPPGPIGSPGRAAIRAVLNPADSDAFYFVAKDDGYHHFSKTYDEHLKAVAKYRRK